MSSSYLYNIACLVLAESDNGKPLRGQRQNHLDTIQDAFVWIKDGLIEDYGKRNDQFNIKEGTSPIDMQQTLVMPAMVDPHTHLVFSGSREDEFAMRLQGASYLDILSKGYGIHQTVADTNATSFDQLYETSFARLKSVEKVGTAGIEIKSGYGLEPEAEIKQLKVIRALQQNSQHPITSTLLAAHAIPLAYQSKRDAYIQMLIEELIPEIARQGLAECIDVFCEKDVFSVDECRIILEKGISLGLKPKLHTDEFYSIGGISLADELNAISVDHMITANTNELLKLQNKNTVAVILPGTSFNMKHTSLDYPRKIIDTNIPLAIGTDFNPGTCMCYSQQIMLELAVLLFGLTIQEAINAITVNASFAACLEKKTGIMERGMRADLISMKAKNINEIPYHWGINKVHQIYISGEKVEIEA